MDLKKIQSHRDHHVRWIFVSAAVTLVGVVLGCTPLSTVFTRKPDYEVGVLSCLISEHVKLTTVPMVVGRTEKMPEEIKKNAEETKHTNFGFTITHSRYFSDAKQSVMVNAQNISAAEFLMQGPELYIILYAEKVPVRLDPVQVPVATERITSFGKTSQHPQYIFGAYHASLKDAFAKEDLERGHYSPNSVILLHQVIDSIVVPLTNRIAPGADLGPVEAFDAKVAPFTGASSVGVWIIRFGALLSLGGAMRGVFVLKRLHRRVYQSVLGEKMERARMKYDAEFSPPNLFTFTSSRDLSLLFTSAAEKMRVELDALKSARREATLDPGATVEIKREAVRILPASTNGDEEAVFAHRAMRLRLHFISLRDRMGVTSIPASKAYETALLLPPAEQIGHLQAAIKLQTAMRHEDGAEEPPQATSPDETSHGDGSEKAVVVETMHEKYRAFVDGMPPLPEGLDREVAGALLFTLKSHFGESYRPERNMKLFVIEKLRAKFDPIAYADMITWFVRNGVLIEVRKPKQFCYSIQNKYKEASEAGAPFIQYVLRMQSTRPSTR